MNKAGRAVLLHRGFLALLALPAWIAPAAARDAPRDPQYAEELRVLESARYLQEIEGDHATARIRLDGLRESRHPEIRARAAYLLGRFLEERNETGAAVLLYRDALESDGLPPVQKQRLIARLLALDPGAVRPFRQAGRTLGLPARAFESSGPRGTEYILEEQSGNGGHTAPRLYRQDARGLLQPFAAALASDEDVLDAAPDRVLTRSGARQRVLLRRAPEFAPVVVQERFAADEGALFAGESGEFLLIGPQELLHMRGTQTLSSHPLPGPGCSWHPSAPGARQGALFCPGQGVYRADFARRAFAPLPLGGEAPSAILLAGEYMALRFMDHVEIRRGPAFDAFLWGFPSGLQDPLALGRGHVFLAADGGPLRAFVLRTGQLDWQRDDAVSALRVHDGELFVLTHARVLLAVDERGRLLYAYEPGWDGEDPLLLPGRDWLVVHNADGARVRLNRELLKLTGGTREHLLRGPRASLRGDDPAGALRQLNALLALEPGNGTVWREKARLLTDIGAPGAEQVQAWKHAARSQGAAAWSADPAFSALAGGLGAAWVWKRQPGPRYFPTLTGGRRFAFYIEGDNQTLVVLDAATGAFRDSHRFPEPLDMKVAAWIGDTLVVSSPGRLYLMAPAGGAAVPAQIALRNPVCHALTLPRGILLSDWSGNLQRIDPATGETAWETRLGLGGLLLAHDAGSDYADVFETGGAWHRVRLADGRTIASADLPPGTITEVHSGRDFAYAGYNEGLIVALDKGTGAVSWQRDMGEQIFSLSGRGDQFLLVGTASRRVVNFHGRTGLVQSQAQIPTHLFNRPLLAGDGYWVGTTEPALEKRSLTHEVMKKFPLTGMPGTPTRVGSGIAVSTLDNFILVFPAK